MSASVHYMYMYSHDCMARCLKRSNLVPAPQATMHQNQWPGGRQQGPGIRGHGAWGQGPPSILGCVGRAPALRGQVAHEGSMRGLVARSLFSPDPSEIKWSDRQSRGTRSAPVSALFSLVISSAESLRPRASVGSSARHRQGV